MEFYEEFEPENKNFILKISFSHLNKVSPRITIYFTSGKIFEYWNNFNDLENTYKEIKITYDVKKFFYYRFFNKLYYKKIK